jgi:heme oxygenase
MSDSATISVSHVRAALRRVTACGHQRLHRQRELQALAKGGLTPEGYAMLLRRLLGLHAPIELALDQMSAHPWLRWRADCPIESRARRLVRDLSALGLAADEIAAAPLAVGWLRDIDTPAAALGCAWVVEGAALGGRVLAARAAELLGPAYPAGGCYFHADPGQDARWAACCAALDGSGPETARVAAICNGASATFAAFGTWLGCRA